MDVDLGEMIKDCRFIGMQLSSRGSKALSDQGLTPIQARVLLYILKHSERGTSLTEVHRETGYTMAAGRALVSCAERDGARYICVTLSDRDDWRDHAALYDWAFGSYECREVISPDTLYRVSAVNCAGSYALARAESAAYALAERGSPEAELTLELAPFVIAPLEAGERAGRIYAYAGGELIAARDLVFTGETT